MLRCCRSFAIRTTQKEAGNWRLSQRPYKPPSVRHSCSYWYGPRPTRAALGALPAPVRASGCCSPSHRLPMRLRRPRLTSQSRSTLRRFKVCFRLLSFACCPALRRADVASRTALSPLVLDDAAGSATAAAFVPQRSTQPPAHRPHIAELFRLAYEARDLRLAPKRAKNARQRERREKARSLDAVSRSEGTALAALYRANLLPPDDMAGLCICDM